MTPLFAYLNPPVKETGGDGGTDVVALFGIGLGAALLAAAVLVLFIWAWTR